MNSWNVKLIFVTVIAGLLVCETSTAASIPRLVETVIDPAGSPGSGFGASVNFTNTVFAGAPGNSQDGPLTGRTFLVHRTTGMFQNPAGDFGGRFGQSVSGDFFSSFQIVVGAPGNAGATGQVYVFRHFTTLPPLVLNNPAGTIGDGFGSSVSVINGKVLVGAPGADIGGADSGAAYLFDAVTGALLNTYVNPAGGAGGQFGYSVSLGADGLLIGAPGDGGGGSATFFDLAGSLAPVSVFDPTPTIDDRFGTAVEYGISGLGGTDLWVGAPGDDTKGTNVGQVHRFDRSSGAAALGSTFDDPTITGEDGFGTSLSVALDGNVLIGAPGDDTNGHNAGQAYYFQQNNGYLLATLDDPLAAAGNKFGQSVSTDRFFPLNIGVHSAIGAPGTNSGSGAVHVMAPVPLPGGLALYVGGLLAAVTIRRAWRGCR